MATAIALAPFRHCWKSSAPMPDCKSYVPLIGPARQVQVREDAVPCGCAAWHAGQTDQGHLFGRKISPHPRTTVQVSLPHDPPPGHGFLESTAVLPVRTLRRRLTDFTRCRRIAEKDQTRF